jgi:hypothetical protein
MIHDVTEAAGETPARKPRNPWPRRVASTILMASIFWWMGHKIALHWGDVKGHADAVRWPVFFLASGMFAFFLFAFRAMQWRRILRGFGHDVPVAPAVRIWSTSELARYVPGVILQVAGRAFLIAPYGVGKTICAASQILELIIFLLANILVGVSCMIAFGYRHLQGDARHAMYLLIPLIPLLAGLAHPRVFFGVMDRVMARMKKPPLAARLSAVELAKLLGWSLLGLAWQSVAIFLIVSIPLGLHWDKFYIVAGTYCLAWSAGFISVLNPGGLGVREGVFIAVMTFAMPASVKAQFPNKAALLGMFAFLSVVLRLWTVVGELILTSVAHAVDHRGALGRSAFHLRHRTRPVGELAAGFSPLAPASGRVNPREAGG